MWTIRANVKDINSILVGGGKIFLNFLIRENLIAFLLILTIATSSTSYRSLCDVCMCVWETYPHIFIWRGFFLFLLSMTMMATQLCCWTKWLYRYRRYLICCDIIKGIKRALQWRTNYWLVWQLREIFSIALFWRRKRRKFSTT